MLKVVTLSVLIAVANAGLLEAPALAPISYPSPIVAAPAPLVAAPVAVKTSLPVATSYQSIYKVSAPVAYTSPVLKAAPVVATAPIAYTAPILKANPIVAPAPLFSTYSAPIVKSGYLSSPLVYAH